MSDTKDRHKFRSSVTARLTEEQITTLEIFLPRLEGHEAKARYLLTALVEIALSETRYRIVPVFPSYGESQDCKIRVSGEVHAGLKKYAKEGYISLGRQVTELLAAGLTVLEEKYIGGGEGLTKEEFKRRMQRELFKQNRLDDIRHGFSLIWRAFRGR